MLAEAAGPAGLPEGLRVGMMVEVPAAALKVEAFLPARGLRQHRHQRPDPVHAWRPSAATARSRPLSDPLDPGVLRLIDHVCRAARGRIDVAVCGEAAADELAIPVLAGLGVHELSVSPAAVPRVKAAVRELDLARCTTLAAQALTLADADDVRKLVLDLLGR